jgi:hypothetical protein
MIDDLVKLNKKLYSFGVFYAFSRTLFFSACTPDWENSNAMNNILIRSKVHFDRTGFETNCIGTGET